MYCGRRWFDYLAMTNLLRLAGLLLCLLVAYLLFWPVQIEPKPWMAPQTAGLINEFAVNDQLANYQPISIDGLHGPEAAILGNDGLFYASTHEGWIVRWFAGSDSASRWVNVGGRPLGIAQDKQGNIWIANAFVGLQKVTQDGIVSVELTESETIAIRYADDLAIAPNGKIYFSDASTKFGAKEVGGTLAASLLDLMEHGLHGRIIEFDPATGSNRVIMRDLSFANGVSIDPLGQFLLVVETGEYRIWKRWLEGEKAGDQELVIENLPGFPDNIHFGKNGRYWVGLTSIRSSVIDALADKPFLRKVVQRLPKLLRPTIQRHGLVCAIDTNGNVLMSLHDATGQVWATTGALETQDALYVTSLTMGHLARYPKNELGLITNTR